MFIYFFTFIVSKNEIYIFIEKIINIDFLKIYHLFSIILFINCTTIGFHNKENLNTYTFSEEITYRLCIYKEESISENRVNSLINDLSKELELYNIKVDAKVISTYNRPAFTTKNIYLSISSLYLPANCDRLMIMLERNIFDFLLHLFLPEVMGLVESETRTRGYIFADYLSVNILVGGTPSNILIHENYHFLGCNHHIIMNDCYKSIHEHRIEALYNIKRAIDFFPSQRQSVFFIRDREKVNQIIKKLSE
jgi:hypothetical protein